MSDVEETELTVEQKHRKEKKDLQAKIQALKKVSAKSDKKKKKEIQEDILRLETDLESRHLQELNISKQEPFTITEDKSFLDNVTPRISKAQKRRDKKAAEDKIRENMILEQEILNINGPRNIETQTIKKILTERGLTLHIIPSNGDCLYGAVAHQLLVTNRQSTPIAGLRKLTAEYVRKYKENFIPFLSDLETGDMLTDQQFEEYCDNIANTTTWGGQVELQALSELLKCRIQIIQSTLPSIITQGEHFEGSPLVITYHRHMYGLGEHYNSTIVRNNENKTDDVTESS